MLKCEYFSQIFTIEVKKYFKMPEGIWIGASISLSLLIVFPVNLNALEVN